MKCATTMTGPISAPTRANGDAQIAHNTTPTTTGATAATSGKDGAGLTESVDHLLPKLSRANAPAEDNAVGRGSVKNRGRLPDELFADV